MDSSTLTPPYKRLLKSNKTLSLRERTEHFGSLLSIYPASTALEVDHGVRLLQNGGVVGMPTETVYGLAGSINSEKALRTIFGIKERPFFDPLIVHISEMSMLGDVVHSWSKICQKLAEEFWPGPLTIVTKKREGLNPLITSGLETVAVRMPAHPVALTMISRFGIPVAAPSANKFGKTSPTSSRHVKTAFPELFVMEGGNAEIGIESTVIEVNSSGITLLRQGYVTAEELKAFCLLNSVAYGAKSDSVATPGHLEHHYQPEIPLVLMTEIQDQSELLECLPALNLAESSKGFELKLEDDPFLSARMLYHRMREGSAAGHDYLYCRWKPEWSGGLWEAIKDRLVKASSLVC
jgi:L-threonylcarbamoyladenylate synthase